ncbi:alpha/beta fold hydrolase [Desulfotruncus arcticus]|uniref:alpha/beta fold hydrolase n=1 Tax=Desulfotruncus arcticus TaxID=341036 RepID=UPI000DF3182E|nr:alpha/beta fold hydrolase [Desulfotruncus arcticus]
MEEQYQASRRSIQDNPSHVKGYANQVNAALKHDTFDRLPQITCPTLVYGGLYDGSCPPEEIRRIAGQIPGARCEFAESGHGSWFFDPSVWEKIISFYKEK